MAVTRILVVDDEPALCDLFRGWLHGNLGAEVECSLTGTAAAQMMIGGRYDLALIDAGLPDTPGVVLAGMAATYNTPALLMSGRPEIIDRLDGFGFPTLKKPFPVTRLLGEAKGILRHAANNIRGVKSSAAEMHRRTRALKAAMAEAHRQVDGMAALRVDAGRK
jgi:DNA-binding response OmpR family regulator